MFINDLKQIYITKEEFELQLESIIESLNETSNTIWIIDNKVAFIPEKIYSQLSPSANESHA